MRIRFVGAAAVLLMVGCATGTYVDDSDYKADPGAGGGGGGGGTATSSSSSSTSASTSSSSSSTTSTTTSTTSGGGSCDMSGDCNTCANCSLTAECSAQANNCLNDRDCTDFLDCISACQDDNCMNACANQYPTGANLYMLMTECAMCSACPVDCAIDGQGLCT